MFFINRKLIFFLDLVTLKLFSNYYTNEKVFDEFHYFKFFNILYYVTWTCIISYVFTIIKHCNKKKIKVPKNTITYDFVFCSLEMYKLKKSIQKRNLSSLLIYKYKKYNLNQ